MDAAQLVKKGGVFAPLQDAVFFRDRLTVINDTVAWDIDGNRDPCALYDICPIVENPLKEVIRAGPYSLNIACQELSRLPRRKDLLNRCGRGTIPKTQSREKTLPGRDWQIPAAPGQEAFLTPYLTTVRAGTRGNSGFKSVKKYLIPSGKCRKALQITIKNLVQAFGSKMPGVRVSPLGPKTASKLMF